MHNMHWRHSHITPSAKFQRLFVYSFIRKQRHIVKNQCKDVCAILIGNYSLVAIENIIINVCYYPVTGSSKKRLNSSWICVVQSYLYSKHGDMQPSQFSEPLKIIFECFDFATSFKKEFLKQSFWRAILFAGFAQNRSIWTGIFDPSNMFITSRGSQLTWLLLSPCFFKYSI